MSLSCRFGAFVALCLLACLPGCGGGDPREDVLFERSRWNVQLLDWVQAPDGSLSVSTRVSGPPNSGIDRLTVMFELRDAAGASLGQRWHTYDLTAIPRGGPVDQTLRLEGAPGVEALRLDLLLQPEPDEEPHMEELRNVP